GDVAVGILFGRERRPQVTSEIRARRVVRRIARDNPLVIRGIAVRLHQSLLTKFRTSHTEAPLRQPAVERLGDLLAVTGQQVEADSIDVSGSRSVWRIVHDSSGAAATRCVDATATAAAISDATTPAMTVLPHIGDSPVGHYEHSRDTALKISRIAPIQLSEPP